MAADPLVSVIMPTEQGRRTLEWAIDSYCRQDYPRKELITVNNYPDWTVGGKRNALCEHSFGDIICHFDDDDISAPDRISRQVDALLRTRSQIVGYCNINFFDTLSGKAYRYFMSPSYACGATLMYRRSFWETHRFLDKNVGEDLPYTVHYRSDSFIEDGADMIVCLLHESNVSSRQSVESNRHVFPEMPSTDLPQWFSPEKFLVTHV